MKYIYLIFLCVILYLYTHKRYIWYLPTIPVYPNNEKDAKRVLDEINKRNKSDIELFYLTNPSVAYAFKPYVAETIEEIQNIFLPYNNIILGFKYCINRARPSQINKTISPLNITTAQTPAYPAGHALQAQILAIVLSKRYPRKKELLYSLAYQCDLCRVRAGLHYISDGEFARQIANILV